MQCPNCKSTKLRVVDTGHQGEVILRRRECKECGERFNTCEAITHIKGTRNKTSEHLQRMKLSSSMAASKEGSPVKLITKVEAAAKRADFTRRRRAAEDMEKYYSDEYVDTQVSDEEVQDLVDLFGETD